jgi:hypothetical protein
VVKNTAKALVEVTVVAEADEEAVEVVEVGEVGGGGVTVAGGADLWDTGIPLGLSTTIFMLVVFAMTDISTIFKLE